MRQHARFTVVLLAALSLFAALGISDAFASNGPGWP